MEYPTLRIGDQTEMVKTLQSMLNKVGGYGLAVDGIFGNKTYDAVKEFQRTNDVPVDGIVSDQTWAKLAVKAGGGELMKTGFDWGTIGLIAAVGLGLFLILRGIKDRE